MPETPAYSKKTPPSYTKEGVSASELLSFATGKKKGEKVSSEDLKGALAKKGISGKDSRKILSAFERTSDAGLDYVISDTGYNVFDKSGQAVVKTSKKTGNKKGFDPGDLIGLGQNTNLLVGFANMFSGDFEESKKAPKVPDSGTATNTTANTATNLPANNTSVTVANPPSTNTTGQKKSIVKPTKNTGTQIQRKVAPKPGRLIIDEEALKAREYDDQDFSDEAIKYRYRKAWKMATEAGIPESEILERFGTEDQAPAKYNALPDWVKNVDKSEMMKEINDISKNGTELDKAGYVFGKTAGLTADIALLFYGAGGLRWAGRKLIGSKPVQQAVKTTAETVAPQVKKGLEYSKDYLKRAYQQLIDKMTKVKPNSPGTYEKGFGKPGSPEFFPEGGFNDGGVIEYQDGGLMPKWNSKYDNLVFRPDQELDINALMKLSEGAVDTTPAVETAGVTGYDLRQPTIESAGAGGNRPDLLETAGTVAKYALPFIGTALANREMNKIPKINYEPVDLMTGAVYDIPKPNMGLPYREPVGPDVQTEIAGQKFADAQRAKGEREYEIQNALSKIAQREGIMERTNQNKLFNKQNEQQVDFFNAQMEANKRGTSANNMMEALVGTQHNIASDLAQRAALKAEEESGWAYEVLRNPDMVGGTSSEEYKQALQIMKRGLRRGTKTKLSYGGRVNQ